MSTRGNSGLSSAKKRKVVGDGPEEIVNIATMTKTVMGVLPEKGKRWNPRIQRLNFTRPNGRPTTKRALRPDNGKVYNTIRRSSCANLKLRTNELGAEHRRQSLAATDFLTKMDAGNTKNDVNSNLKVGVLTRSKTMNSTQNAIERKLPLKLSINLEKLKTPRVVLIRLPDKHLDTLTGPPIRRTKRITSVVKNSESHPAIRLSRDLGKKACRPRTSLPESSCPTKQPRKEKGLTALPTLPQNRTYYHSMTRFPIQPTEILDDSDTEDSEWFHVKTSSMMDEFIDVNEGEKEFMKMWNLHIQKHSYIYVGDYQIPGACNTFVDHFGREIIQKNLYRNFILHLTNLIDFGLLSSRSMYLTIQRLQAQMKDTTANSLGKSQKIKKNSSNSYKN